MKIKPLIKKTKSLLKLSKSIPTKTLTPQTKHPTNQHIKTFITYLRQHPKIAKHLPWTIIVNTTPDSTSNILQHTNTHFTYTTAAPDPHEHFDCWLADDGVFLEATASLLNEPTPQPGFALFTKYRSYCHPRALIVTLNTQQIFSGEVPFQALRRFVDALYKQLKHTLPLYLVITDLHKLTGFHAFYASATPEERQHIMGITAEPLTREHLDQGFTALDHLLTNQRWRVLEAAYTDQNTFLRYAFPEQCRRLCDSLHEPLAAFVRTNAYQVTPVVHGVYFTGVSNETTYFYHDLFQDILATDQSSQRPLPLQSRARKILEALRILWIAIPMALSFFWFNTAYTRSMHVLKANATTPTSLNNLQSQIDNLAHHQQHTPFYLRLGFDHTDSLLLEKKRLFKHEIQKHVLHPIQHSLDALLQRDAKRWPMIPLHDLLQSPDRRQLTTRGALPKFYTAALWIHTLKPQLLIQTKQHPKAFARYQTRYLKHYRQTWIRFLNQIRQRPFTSLQDAAAQLTLDTGAHSPIKELYQHIATNLTLLTPHRPLPKLDHYLNALTQLKDAITNVANAADPQQAAWEYTRSLLAEQKTGSALEQSHQTLQHLTHTIDDPTLRKAIHHLLSLPITTTWHTLLKTAHAYLNDEWQTTVYTVYAHQLVGKFPLDPFGLDPDPGSFETFFQPKDGVLWQFVKTYLTPVIDQHTLQPKTWLGAGILLTPTFLATLTQAANFTKAFYETENTRANFTFALYPQPNPNITQLTLTTPHWHWRYRNGPQHFIPHTWHLTNALTEINLTGVDRTGTHPQHLHTQGPWALLRLFHYAKRQPLNARTYHLEWHTLHCIVRCRTSHNIFNAVLGRTLNLPRRV